MDIKQIASIVLYVIDVTVCLIAIGKKSPRVYALTKPFLMPLLYCVYFYSLPVMLRHLGYQKFAFYALMLHSLGDIFLLFPRNKGRHMFYLGMLSFFMGHICYCLWFAKAPVGHTKRWTVFVLIICLLLEYLIYRQLMLGPRKDAPKLVPYSLGLCAVAVSIASTMGAGSPLYATIISQVGIALFFFSDFCIMRRMVRLPLFGQMTVMTTYIAGQSLIVLGMLLLQT